MEGHIGEIATIDIDNDGEDEIMTIEEFHGDTIQILGDSFTFFDIDSTKENSLVSHRLWKMD